MEFSLKRGKNMFKEVGGSRGGGRILGRVPGWGGSQGQSHCHHTRVLGKLRGATSNLSQM